MKALNKRKYCLKLKWKRHSSPLALAKLTLTWCCCIFFFFPQAEWPWINNGRAEWGLMIVFALWSWKCVFWISLYRQLSDSNKRDGIINGFSQVAMPNNVYLLSFHRIPSPNGGSIHSHVKHHPFSILGFIPDRALPGGILWTLT